jgi:formate dehydrogenase major subunit
MELTRRSFLKATGLAFAGSSLAFGLSNESTAFAMDPQKEWKLENTQEYTTICCYCACGCGMISSVRDGKLVHVEGDPDHVINEGGLCPKGAGQFQAEYIVNPETGELEENPGRVLTPKVRRPGADDWEDISWDQAISEIARHMKDTRDKAFEKKNDDGVTVNRNPAIACLGGSSMTIEEQYLIVKLFRELGCLSLDNQARV